MKIINVLSERRVPELCAVTLLLQVCRLNERPSGRIGILKVLDLNVQWGRGWLHRPLALALQLAKLLFSEELLRVEC